MKIFLIGLLGGWWVAGSLPGAWAAAEPVPAAGPGAQTAGASAAVDGDQLKFRNNDLMHGTFVSVGAEGLLRWRRADVEDPIRFRLDHVQELRLAPQPLRMPRTPPRSVVELTNGDRLAGDVAALNDQTLQLDTWYAGRLELKRALVQRISLPADVSAAAYTGPTGLADWNVSPGPRNTWQFQEGAFISPLRNAGSLGRNVNLPDVANIEFDLAWQDPLHLMIGCCCENLTSAYGGGCTLRFMHTSVQLVGGISAVGIGMLGNVEVPQLQTKHRARISIRIHKAQKTVALLVDNELVKQWTIAAGKFGNGRGLVFQASGMGSFRIANIAVMPWNGQLDKTAGAAPVGEDLVRLANSDKVSGAVRSIAKQTAVVATSFGSMKVPLERIVRIEFTGQKAGLARRQAGDVRAVFPDGSHFTLALERMDEATLTGSTESCGHVTLMLAAFRRIQFHIYDPRPKAGGEQDRDGVTGGDEPAWD